MRGRSLPDNAEIVTDYTTLERFVEAFTAGLLNLLLLIGRPGLEKSWMLRQHVSGDSCWIEGNCCSLESDRVGSGRTTW